MPSPVPPKSSPPRLGALIEAAAELEAARLIVASAIRAEAGDRDGERLATKLSRARTLAATARFGVVAAEAVDARYAHERDSLFAEADTLLARIVHDLPAPGEREAAGEAGALNRQVAVLKAYLASPLVPEGRSQAMRTDLCDRIAHAAVVYQRTLTRLLDQSEGLDLRTVSIDLLRLDVLEWLLDDLEATPQAQANLRAQARATAHAALRRARLMIDAFIRKRGPARRFEIATLLVEVDALIDLIDRVRAHGATHSLDVGEALATSTIHSLGKLVLALFRDLADRHQASHLTADGLRGGLRKIERIIQLLKVVDPHENRLITRAVERCVTVKTDGMVRLMAPDRTCLAELKGFLERVSEKPGG